MGCSPSFYSPLWLMPPPRPNLRLRLMPPLMPGTHTTVTVIPDTMVPTADTTVLDGVDTTVDITGTPDTDTDTGSAMLKLKLRLRLNPTLPSSTPASMAMDLPMDTLIMAMELTPPPPLPPLTDTTLTPLVLFMPLLSVMPRPNLRLMPPLMPTTDTTDTDILMDTTAADGEDTMAMAVIMDGENKPH